MSTYAASGRLSARAFARAQLFAGRKWPLPAFFLLSLVMTWPLVTQLGMRIPSDTGSDMLVHEWTLWWLERTLLNLQNPLFTDLLVYPTGVALTSHNIAWLNFGLWFPLACAFGRTAATSLTYILIFTFNAYAMYLFACSQVRSRTAGWVAGLIFGFFPTTLSDGGHVNMLAIGWLPLALLYLDRVIARGGWRNTFFAGLFLALLGITRWQLLVIGAPLAALFVLFRLFSSRHGGIVRTLGRLTASAVIASTIMVPFLFPLIVDQLTRPGAEELLLHEPVFSADLLSYVVPHSRLLLWQWLVQLLPASLQFPQQEVAFIGYTVLLLAACAFILRRRSSLLWLLMAAILVVLALGPIVAVGQQRLDWLYTPYRLIENTFYDGIVRKPWRYNVFMGLPLAMLGALGVGALHARYGRRAHILVLAVSLLILAEYWMEPYPTIAVDMVPAWYQQLAHEPGDFAIVGMPISSRWADKYYMYYQVEHGKPMVGGHISRPPVESIAYMVKSPFLYDMLYMRDMDPAVVDVTHQLRYLAQAGVRYLILHKNFVSAELINAWKDWLTFDPVYEDDITVVYRTAPKAGSDFAIQQKMTPALGAVNAAFEPAELQPGDPLTVDVRWGTDAAVTEDYEYCVDLVPASGAPAEQECMPISPDWPTSRWQANEVARSTHTFRVDPFLPPGEYRVRVMLRDGGSGAAAGEQLDLGSLDVDPLPRVFALPTPEVAVGAHFGADIQLYGYDLAVEDSGVKLVLYWSADRRLDRSYKVFVHAVDRDTGEILAQYDAAPRNWAYPTTWWEAGEVVSDPIDLPLADAGHAQAQLLVGLYDEMTGERLPLVGGTPERAGDALTIALP
jgi:hypothetical protein